ncbi:MAG TPA: hypothetical protein VFE47_24500 [Tepidisphaeraceae bacterium]|jgi:hypothetical protein|nr:hypothetical protein [Tepidisphaeraceae bacterium]
MESSTTVARAELWRQRIVAQMASGQKIRAWCKVQGIHEHSFHRWRARLGLSPVRQMEQPQIPGGGPVGFSTVVVVEPGQAPATHGSKCAESIRLSLLGGRELTLPTSMPVEQLARLVHAIEGTGFDTLAAGGFDRLTAGGFDRLTAGGPDAREASR